MARPKDPREPTKEDRFLGQRLRQARIEANVTQEALGAHLGVSFQQVQKYEKGLNRLPPNRLAMCAEKLDKPITFFFQGEHSGTWEPGEAMSKFLTSKEGIKVANLFFTMPYDSRTAMITLMEQLSTSH